MPLPSFLQRLRGMAAPAQSEAQQPPLSASDVEATRARARRRLVGMVVLVGAGILGFPWLFETQPRPMSADVQMVHARDVAPVRMEPAPRDQGAMSQVPSSDAVAPPSPSMPPET